MTHDHAATTMQAARTQYFRDNAFGDDGGYDDAWVDFKLGPLPMPFPNTKGRVRAVRYHDLHHILTGYRTDLRGELEISAWELGAGCKDFYAAWALNLGGVGLGAWLMPRRTFRAFVRGRRSQSLYGLPFEQVLQQTVTETRAAMGVADDVRPTAKDVALYVATAIAGLALGTILFWSMVPFIPVGLFMNVVRNRQRRAAVGSS
jgi:hypothetical protein